MEQLIETNLNTYGPIAVFLLLMLSGVGIALGEEMVTLPAGVFIATGKLEFWSTAACAYTAIVLADFMWFWICRHYGTRLLHKPFFKRLVHPRRMLELKHQLERRGAWVIVTARFIPSSRTAAITVAGIFHMPFWQFAVTTVTCVLITVPMQLGLGYLVGRGMDEAHSFTELMWRIVGVVVVVIMISLAIRVWRGYRRGHHRAPRARASWLRRFRRSSRTGATTGSK
jgi:membrane protein DedA with SNARE-associated domain